MQPKANVPINFCFDDDDDDDNDDDDDDDNDDDDADDDDDDGDGDGDGDGNGGGDDDDDDDINDDNVDDDGLGESGSAPFEIGKWVVFVSGVNVVDSEIKNILVNESKNMGFRKSETTSRTLALRGAQKSSQVKSILFRQGSSIRHWLVSKGALRKLWLYNKDLKIKNYFKIM